MNLILDTITTQKQAMDELKIYEQTMENLEGIRYRIQSANACDSIKGFMWLLSITEGNYENNI